MKKAVYFVPALITIALMSTQGTDAQGAKSGYGYCVYSDPATKQFTFTNIFQYSDSSVNFANQASSLMDNDVPELMNQARKAFGDRSQCTLFASTEWAEKDRQYSMKQRQFMGNTIRVLDWQPVAPGKTLTAAGEGSSKITALADARHSAVYSYGYTIKQWGTDDCKQIPKPTRYDVAGHTKMVWHCDISFRVVDDSSQRAAVYAYDDALTSERDAQDTVGDDIVHKYSKYDPSFLKMTCGSEVKQTNQYQIKPVTVYECVEDATVVTPN